VGKIVFDHPNCNFVNVLLESEFKVKLLPRKQEVEHAPDGPGVALAAVPELRPGFWGGPLFEARAAENLVRLGILEHDGHVEVY
jgi:hypothetical protein